MKLQEFARTTCEGSSIHGVVYLTKRELHWTERVFWAIIIVLATYFSIRICWNQWERYKENPIVYAVQLARHGNNFPYSAFTICTNYENNELFAELIAELWQCNRECKDLEYFWNFLRVVNLLRYDNLEILEPYVNDTRLKEFNFLDALKMLHSPVMRKLMHPLEEDTKYAKGITNDLLFAPSIQEAGLCRSTSRVTKYTNPYAFNKPLGVQGIMNCTNSPCDINITPDFENATILHMYTHSVEDIASPNHFNTIMNVVYPGKLRKTYMNVQGTSAEATLRNLPISYRKCRYKDENILQYFDDYIIGLCIMECRINAALKLCNCKPYFYMAAAHMPTCNIDGLHCLATNNWAKTDCNCMPLCENVIYIPLQSGAFEGGPFTGSLYFSLSIPDVAIHRRIVFSSDQLLISFGGVISLFLGMSFISVYGLVYYVSDFIGSNMLVCWRRYKYRWSKTQTQ